MVRRVIEEVTRRWKESRGCRGGLRKASALPLQPHPTSEEEPVPSQEAVNTVAVEWTNVPHFAVDVSDWV